jgi:biopolymer transport protein ExbB
MSRLRTLLPALAAFLATARTAAAQGESSGGISFGEAIEASGIVGFVIIGLSVVALALVIEHFISIKREKLAPPELVDEIEELFGQANYQAALETCEQNPCYFTRVTAAGIRKIGHPFETMEKAVEEMEGEENLKLMVKIGWLSLIAGLGPMLGLFGTVVGMVGAFGKISDAGPGGVNPSELAGNIQMALVTTVEGLIVAIPTTAFFAFFRNRVTSAALEIGAVIEDLFERFRGK